VLPLSAAAVAAGAAGLIVEVHPDPAHAMSDGAQSLDFAMFEELARRIHPTKRDRETNNVSGQRVLSVK
jgi:3-deoxy-7-phosphoheptulonate synthase